MYTGEAQVHLHSILALGYRVNKQHNAPVALSPGNKGAVICNMRLSGPHSRSGHFWRIETSHLKPGDQQL